MKVVLSIIISVCVFVGGVVVGGTVVYSLQPSNQIYYLPVEKTESDLSESILWDEVQTWRKYNNYPEYKKNYQLCAVAYQRVNEIKTDWSHGGFWKHLKEYEKFLNYERLGENLAKDFIDESSTLQGWLDSQPHREILEANFTDSCIVTSDHYAVQVFANF